MSAVCDDRGCGLRLLGQSAVDHVQPAFDPDPLLGIAHRKQPPALQRRLDLQAADAPAARGAEADRDRRVGPAHPFQHIEHGLGDHRGQRADQFVDPEFPAIAGRPAGAASRRRRRARRASTARSGSDPHSSCASPSAARCRRTSRHRRRGRPTKRCKPVDIKLRVARALIVDQPRDAFADHAARRPPADFPAATAAARRRRR